MKELSIEEKSKAYEMALEKAEEIIRYYKEHNRGDEAAIEDLETIFPELKENKMEWIEKIRQELISYLGHREVKKISESDACLQWIDWLEKQGEQRPIKASYTTIVETGNGGVNTCVTRELSNGEQKPTENKDAEKAAEEYRNFRMSCGVTDPVMLDEIEEAYYEGAIKGQKKAMEE